MSGLDTAVPEQREQQPDADRQSGETKDEHGEAPDGRKGPEACPRDETKQRRRS